MEDCNDNPKEKSKSRDEDSGNSTKMEDCNDIPKKKIKSRDEDSGFGRFLAGIYSFFILQNITHVATALDFKPALIDQLERSSNPQLKFFHLLKEKGVISSSDISKLLDALVVCDLGGIATDVNEKFEQYLDEKIGKLEFTAQIDSLVLELKATYRDLYDAVQPIPYIRDRLYCVDHVFVESGIKLLVEKGKVEGPGIWETLPSYHSMLNDLRVKSERLILEGEPGYGKSTITLQLAYDWCQKVNDPYLKKIDVLILLRLRQLGQVTSIYKAIKQFLLPKESKLTEEDIKYILENCASVMVVLDGFDEYPDNEKETDIMKIIERRMFQRMRVVLTTRSSYLPLKYPALTKRLKLTGFDDFAREKYIQKAVARGDNNVTKKIKHQLKENPIIGDLCQVPLIFVMFAHMCHESEHFQKFSSVTSFFRYMISCFHGHLRNKMKDANVKKYNLLETEHSVLDKLAFEGLLSGKIIWEKEEMWQLLGEDFYDLYVSLGILVEEEVLRFDDSELIEYKTEVRFYHKLFCEWYAAFHLCEYAIKNTLTSNSPGENEYDLTNLSPSDVQYAYRFACGLNHKAGQKIIDYLKSRGDAQKCTILCVLEQGGEEAETVLQSAKDLCSQEVKISADDSQLIQRSTIMLLEIAATNKISIKKIHLYDCLVEKGLPGGNHLKLKHNLSMPVFATLKTIVIDEAGRKVTSSELISILQYSSKCMELEICRFRYCLLPQSVNIEFLSDLRSRLVKVEWFAGNWFVLNLDSGAWRNDVDYGGNGKVMSEKDFQRAVTWVRNYPDQAENYKRFKESDETHEFGDTPPLQNELSRSNTRSLPSEIFKKILWFTEDESSTRNSRLVPNEVFENTLLVPQRFSEPDLSHPSNFHRLFSFGHGSDNERFPEQDLSHPSNFQRYFSYGHESDNETRWEQALSHPSNFPRLSPFGQASDIQTFPEQDLSHPSNFQRQTMRWKRDNAVESMRMKTNKEEYAAV